jgi:hypothetical protein
MGSIKGNGPVTGCDLLVNKLWERLASVVNRIAGVSQYKGSI